jgi:hypothetical protein
VAISQVLEFVLTVSQILSRRVKGKDGEGQQGKQTRLKYRQELEEAVLGTDITDLRTDGHCSRIGLNAD